MKSNPIKSHLLPLIFIMAGVAITSTIFSLSLVFNSSIKTEEAHLSQMVQSQGNLINAVRLFESETHGQSYEGGPNQEAIRHAITALEKQGGFGQTGEFVLGRKKDGKIEFLVNSRMLHRRPDPLPLGGKLATPTQLALAGKSGLVTALDYRNVPVLAAYMPLPELGLSLVSKIDMVELYQPFLRSVAMAAGTALFTIGLATLLVWQLESDAFFGNRKSLPFLVKKVIGWPERTFYLLLIMAGVTTAVTSTANIMLYHASYARSESYLAEMVNSQKRLIELIDHHDLNQRPENHETIGEETLNRFIKLYNSEHGFGRSGEFVLGRMRGTQIHFLLRSFITGEKILPVAATSDAAGSMRHALSGLHGVSVDKDYRSVDVLAAYAPINILHSGLVAKIDLAELRQPFLSAGIYTFTVSSVLILVGSFFMARRMASALTNPRKKEMAAMESSYLEVFPGVSVLLLALSVWLAVAILALDLAMPLGVAGGVPYVAFVLLGRWYPNRQHVFVLAIIASILSIAGCFLSEKVGVAEWMVWTNRLYSLFVIWITALSLSLIKASEIEINKQTSELKKFSTALEQSPSSILITNAVGKIEYVNAQFTHLTGYQFEEVVGKTPRVLKSDQQDPHLYKLLWRQILSGKAWQGELINKHKTGKHYWASVSINPLYDATGIIRNFVGIQHDITATKETERWFSKVTRDLKTRFRFAEILETANDEVETLHQLCRVLHEEAGYQMVWVGLVETNEPKRVVLLAHHGFDNLSLEQLNISWCEDSPQGKSPTGRAVRTCLPQIIRDVRKDPDHEPWRKDTLKKEITSSVALPLMNFGKVFGVLNLYTDQTDAFDNTEVMLLSALSKHMSDGILRIRESNKRLLAEENLKNSELRFRTLFDSMTNGVAIYRAVDDGEDFIFLDMNEAGTIISNVDDREALKGRRVTEAFPGIREFGLLDIFKQVYRTGQSMRHPISYYQDGRHKAWLENSVFKLASGEIATVYDDLTEQKQAEDQLRLAQVSLENTNDMVFWLFPDGRFFRFNQSVCDRLGYSREVLMTMRASDLNPEHPQEEWPEHWAQLKEKRSLRFEADLTRLNAPPLPVEISANFMVFNGMEYNMAILRDITERRKMEADLRLSEEKANQANRAKSEFLAKMSHEIRTPMNSIIGISYLAQQTGMLPQQERYLKKIDTAAKALLRIINDILDFSKIDAGKLDLEQEHFNLADVLEQVIDGLMAKYQFTRNIELLLFFPFDLPVNLVGDSGRLAQILTNLGDNAIKFTKQGEVLISVELESMTDDHASLCFTIEDTGIGIASENIDKLFQSFQQSDNSITRQYGGTGLGLTICRALVELMGGYLDLESTLGKGTRITFHLDFPRSLQKEDKIFTHASCFQGKRVLIMDGNKATGKVLQKLLSSLQLDGTTVTSGQTGIQTLTQVAAEGAAYDLVLLDWKISDSSDKRTLHGEEILYRLQNDLLLRDTPVIIMAYEFEMHEIMPWIEAMDGCVFLQKPVMPGKLLASLVAAFKLSVSDVAPARPSRQTARKNTMELQGYHILLVDDMKENRDLVQEILQSRGASVAMAENGQQALEMVTQVVPIFDMVLMDMQMPVMDGLEATRKIRNFEQFKNLPIIALTASAMVEDVNQCLAAGMNDYLGKPIDVELLFAKLIQWVPGKTVFESKTLCQEHTAADDENMSLRSQQYPGLDVVASLNRCGGDEIFHSQLIANFINNNHNSADTIRTFLENQDFDSAHRQVHKLRNSAGNISAMEVFGITGECERAILHRDSQTALSRLSALKTSLETAIASGRNFLQKEKNHVVDLTPVALDQLMSSLNVLAKMLDTRELKAIQLFEQIKAPLSTMVQEKDCLLTLEKHVEHLEFAPAKAALEAMVHHLEQSRKIPFVPKNHG